MSMREVQLLGYHTSVCPYCKKTIHIPEYRIQPGTTEAFRKYNKELLERIRKAERNE